MGQTKACRYCAEVCGTERSVHYLTIPCRSPTDWQPYIELDYPLDDRSVLSDCW